MPLERRERRGLLLRVEIVKYGGKSKRGWEGFKKGDGVTIIAYLKLVLE